MPEGVAFATKPQIACALIAQALDAGAPCAWVLADALYGSDSRLRRMLEKREQPYVLAVRSNHRLRFWTEEGLEETDPATMADALACVARTLRDADVLVRTRQAGDSEAAFAALTSKAA